MANAKGYNVSVIDVPGRPSKFWRDPVAVLPGRGDFVGETRLLTSSNVVYVWSGAAWVAVLSAGDVLYNMITGFTNGSVIFASGGTLAQDNANFFWDDTNNRLGIGTSAPNYPLHLAGYSTNPASNPSGATAVLNYDQLSGFPTGNYTSEYKVYAHKAVGGTDYYSATPSTTNSVTDDGRSIGASAGILSGTINYGSGGYQATGQTIDVYLYTKVNRPQGVVWSSAYAGSVTADFSFLQFNIDWTFGSITPTEQEYYLYRVSDGYYYQTGALGSPPHIWNDTNSSWVSGGSAPTPTAVQDTYTITVSWDAVGSIDSYKILKQNTYNGYTYNYSQSVAAGTTTLVDNGSGWALDSVVTPTTINIAALYTGTGDVGLYGATPTAQYNSPGTSGGFAQNSGNTVYDASTFTGNLGTTAYTIGDIVKALKLIGIMAS